MINFFFANQKQLHYDVNLTSKYNILQLGVFQINQYNKLQWHWFATCLVDSLIGFFSTALGRAYPRAFSDVLLQCKAMMDATHRHTLKKKK